MSWKKNNYMKISLISVIILTLLMLVISIVLFGEKNGVFSKKTATDFAIFYSSLMSIIINIFTICLLYFTFFLQTKESIKNEHDRRLIKEIDSFESLCNNLSNLIENKLKLNIYNHTINQSFFETVYYDISESNSKDIDVFQYINSSVKTTLTYLFVKANLYNDVKTKFLIFLSNLNITNTFLTFINDMIENPKSKNVFIQKRKIKNDLPLIKFNFDKPLISDIRIEISYVISQTPFFIHPFTLNFISNFETCLYLLEILENSNISNNNEINTTYFENYKKIKLEYYKNFFKSTITINENVFLINYYLYDFDKFPIIDNLGLFNYLNDKKLHTYFYEADNLLSDYIKIKEYLTNVSSPNSKK